MNVTFENIKKSGSLVIAMAFGINLSCGVVEECKHIHSPVANVLEFFQPGLHFFGLQCGSEALEELDPRTLIKEEQVFRRIGEQEQKMFHLGKKVRIGNMQEIAGAVRFEPFFSQYALDRGLAWRRVDGILKGFQVTLCPSQSPAAASRQRFCLTIERDNFCSGLQIIGKGVSRSGEVVQIVGLNLTLAPVVNRVH